jgi:cobalamin biosynthesis Mg chelatase CobN
MYQQNTLGDCAWEYAREFAWCFARSDARMGGAISACLWRFFGLLPRDAGVLECHCTGGSAVYNSGARRMSHVAEDEVEERVARLESDVAHIQSDIGEIKVDIREMRAQMQQGFASLREADASLRSDLAKYDSSARGEIASLRGDLAKYDSSLRGDLAKYDTSLRGEIASLRVEMVKSDWATRMWMVCLIGVVLSVMAHGFHWI